MLENVSLVDLTLLFGLSLICYFDRLSERIRRRNMSGSDMRNVGFNIVRVFRNS
jgi:hypothetical protein